MKQKHLILLIIFLAKLLTISAQNTVTISGYIRDSVSTENLYNATIFAPNLNIGTISNSYGFYSITLPSGPIDLRASFVGYQHLKKSFHTQNDTTINFELKSQNDLDEVIIKAPARKEKTQFAGHSKVNMQTVKSLPAFAGEQDVLKTLTILPGVQQGHEGSSGLFVRGGSPDQNLILLDGVPIYNASHLFGLISVFTPEALQSVDFYKGGFPARYGGRLSSVIDVRMKEGNKNKHHTNLTFGVITSKLTHEGPIKQGKSSYILTARRTLLDLLVSGAAKATAASVVPSVSCHDFNAKLNFEITPKNHFYISFYGGGDLLSSQFKDNNHGENAGLNHSKIKLNWGNKISTLRWTSQLGKKLHLNTSLSSGTFNYTIDNTSKQTYTNTDLEEKWSHITYATKVNNNKLQLLFDWYLSKHKVQFGTSIEINQFNPGRQTINKHDGTNIKRGENKLTNFGASFFADDRFSIGNRISMQAGLRLDIFDLNGEFISYITPRLNTKFIINNNFTLFTSYSQMVQPIHLLTNSSLGLPSDIWVPATKNILPEKSNQITLGGEIALSNQLNFKLDTYYKVMEGVINYKAGHSFMDIYENWENQVEIGKGKAWGFENALNYKNTRINAWLNYTLSWNNREFKQINNGKSFPFKFDRRHDINIGCIYQLAENIECSAVWTYQTGHAATLPMQNYHAAEPITYALSNFFTDIDMKDTHRIEYFNDYNNYRLPAFHHLDASITFTKHRINSIREWKIGIYNIYAKQNPYMYYPQTTNEGLTQYKKVCMFPIIPALSYHIKF